MVLSISLPTPLDHFHTLGDFFSLINCLYFGHYLFAPGSIYCAGTQEISLAASWTQICNCNNHTNNISLGLLFYVYCLNLYTLVATSTTASFLLPLYLIHSIFRNIHLDLGTNSKLFNKSCSSGRKKFLSYLKMFRLPLALVCFMFSSGQQTEFEIVKRAMKL